MTKEEAWRIIEACRSWNTSQRSISLICNAIRTAEDDVLDARRAALAEAWRVVGEQALRPSELDKPMGKPLELDKAAERN